MNTASASLLAHGDGGKGGARIVTLDELSLIEPPNRTWSHKPVKHIELINVITESFGSQGVTVEKVQCAIQNDGAKLYSVMVLSHAKQDFKFALGVRTANNKTLAITFTVGLRVLVCDNGCFSGESMVMDRKHTGGLNLYTEVNAAVARSIAKFKSLDKNVDRLKRKNISDTEAKALILDAAIKGVMPLNYIKPVADEWFTPRHAEFEPRTLWSLHNAFTEAFKTRNFNLQMEETIELGNLFGI